MRINRMFEIIYMLLDEGVITASELASRFEVSIRTIYRDVENISAAGIPIYMTRGKNGGISLAKGYTMNKAILSDEEKMNLMDALQSYHSFSDANTMDLISKLGVFLGRDTQGYIEIDLMDWGDRVKKAYSKVKQAILEQKIIEFEYVSPDSGISNRRIEPYTLYFKSSTWYVKSFCLDKQSERLFRLSRMKHIVVTDTVFKKRVLESVSLNEGIAPKVTLKLQIEKGEEYRVLDEFSGHEIKRHSNGDYIIETEMIDSNWIVGYLMSYGKSLTVISPKSIRDKIKDHVKGLSKNYL